MKTKTNDKHDQHADHKSNQPMKHDDAKKIESLKTPSNTSEKKPTFPESKKSK
jgi:hypothetical protein